MKRYIIRFKPLSVITELPDGQKLFGAFCYSYNRLYGEEKLEKMLECQYANPTIIFSSLFFDNVLPCPMDFMPNRLKNPSLIDVKESKKYKKIKFFSKSVFNDYKNNKEEFEKSFYLSFDSKYRIIKNELLCSKNENIVYNYVKDSRTRNSSDRELFKDQVFYLDENMMMYAYMDIYDEGITENILGVIKNMRYISLGGFKSIGYNLYNVEEVIEINDCKRYGMLLSKSVLPNDIDIDNSFYSLNVANNKYTKGETIYKNGLVVLNEGSVISSTNSNYVGSIVKDEKGGKYTYRYYIGYLI
jgi:CRISPR type III-A-associated RAMP protein Csm4